MSAVRRDCVLCHLARTPPAVQVLGQRLQRSRCVPPLRVVEVTLVALALTCVALAGAQSTGELVITRAAARPSPVAPAENFTGAVRGL